MQLQHCKGYSLIKITSIVVLACFLSLSLPLGNSLALAPPLASELKNIRPIRLLLVDLASPRHEVNEVLGVEVIAGHIRERYGANVKVEIIDMQFGATSDDILQKIKDEPVDIIGLSVKIGSYETAKKRLDAIFSDVVFLKKKPLVVLGNTIATFAHRKLLLEQYKDVIIVVGEGEDALLDITTVLNEKVPQKHRTNIRYIKEKLVKEGVPNIAVNIDGKVVESSRKPVDLNKVTGPARDTLGNVVSKGGIVTIEGSRGCPWNACTFCAARHRFKQWRPYPVEKIIDELKDLSKKMVRNVYFVDEDFIGPRIERAEELAKKIIEAKEKGEIALDMRFSISTRVAAIFLSKEKRSANLKKIELFKLLKRAGLHIVFLGIESGSNSQLKRFNKGVTADENKEAIRILNELGIVVEPGFIMFDPKMTLEELKENIEFLESAGLAHTTSKVTGELRIQAGSAFVKMLNCSEDNLDLNSLSYPHSFLNKDVSDIHKEFTEWESQTKHVVYYLQGITRGNAPSEERSRAEQLLIKLRKLNLDFLKAYVKMKASTSKIDDVRKPLIIQRNDILSEILSLITNKKLPIVDDFIGNELVRLIIREEKCSAGTDQISSFGKLAEAILIMP